MLSDIKREQFRAASVDLRTGEIFRISPMEVIDIEHDVWPSSEPIELPYILKPGEYVLARTIETINQPKKKYGCFLSTRSRAFRIGLHIACGFFGPYYEGKIVFGIKNVGTSPVRLYSGMSLIHAVFLEIKGESKEFNHDFQFGKIL